MLSLNRTLAFRDFQRVVGDCTAHINTAYVGTELIARGAKKPDDLHIKWQAPKSPRTFVEQTRSLLHAAMLGHVFMAVDRYLRDLADDRWINLQQAQRDILKKAVTKTGGHAYSLNERFEEIRGNIDSTTKVDGLLVDLLATWRNRNVHEDSSKEAVAGSRDARLTDSTRKALREADACISQRYGQLSITELISHLDQNKAPTRKDIVALASASQNYVREIDKILLISTIKSEQDLVTIAEREVARSLLKANGAVLAQLWGKDLEARRRRISATLQEVGFTPTKDVISFHLPDDFVIKLAQLPSAKAAEETLKQHYAN